MAKTKSEASLPVQSVVKALALLDRLALGDARRQGVSLASLAAEFGWPLNSTHNLLKTLVGCDYVALRGRGVYGAGSKCEQMRRVAGCANAAVRERVLRVLRAYADAENEGCVCVMLADGQRVMVGAVDGNHAIRVSHATVEATPFFAKATGRMLAALADERELAQVVARHGLPGEQWNGLDDLETLRAELAKLRRQGWCEIEQIEDEVVALACPILDADGGPWGALGAFAPAYRCPAERRRQLLDRLRATARELGEMLHL